MIYHVFWVEVPAQQADAAEALLSILPHQAIDRETIKEITRFGIYLAVDMDDEPLAALAEQVGALRFHSERLAERDWVALSHAGLPPVQAGRFYLYGTHHAAKLAPPGAIGLHIDAATAFGTGHHETTQGCLMMIDRLLKRQGPAFRKRPRAMLDMGCGTAVLALGLAKALKRSVDAYDIDAESVRVANENCALNQGSHWVRCYQSNGYHRVKGRYDLIVANILARPLVAMSQDAARHLKPGGQLILAGLLDWQRAQVINAHKKQGLKLVDIVQVGRWPTLLMQKP